MTVTPAIEADIRRLFFAEHWKSGTIAAQLGVHRDAVERVIGHLGPKTRDQKLKARVLDPYLSFLDETLSTYPKLVATRLFDMIRERGYQGSLRSLRRYLTSARPRRKVAACLRIETLPVSPVRHAVTAIPGEQGQVDWAHAGELLVPGGRRSLWAFVMVLRHFRASFAELVVSLDVHSLRRSLVRAATFFGGMPRQWLFDNAKTIVIERHSDAVRYHPLLLDLAAKLHVQHSPTN